MRLANKVAIITGAAHGMGAVTAQRFAQEGAKVVIADMLEEQGAEVVSAIASSGGQALFARLDVQDDANWAEVVAAAQNAFGPVGLLVNNAGISGSAFDDPHDTDAWDVLLSVNAKGVFLGHKNVIPTMQANGGGAIVNLSSISGNAGQNRVHGGYNASKGAVRMLTKSAAVQFARDGIRANSVHPGLMPAMRTSGATADPKVRAKMLERVPMRRTGEPVEVANAVLFLASDEASYITGSELHVDGGYLAS
ncbi:MAG: glucose 1-dehydrogenase [Gammaproteobacteria bacterium]|nr:glucose 1-dehydrogenase [Gammaproteobacteria bacterium]